MHLNEIKMKVITVSQQYIKNNIFLIVFAKFASDFQNSYDLKQSAEYQNHAVSQLKTCTQESKDLQDIIIYGNAVMLMINCLSALFIYCKKHFARTEFVILYILNLMWIGLLFIFCFLVFSKSQRKCQAFFMTQVFTLIQTIKNEAEIICIVYLPIHITNRYLTQGSDLIFAILFGYVAMGKTTCKTGNEKVAYFVFILHVVFGVVGLLLNVFSNLKKYHKQLAKGLLFLEAIMITILVVIWIILYENLDKTTQSKSEKCQRLSIIENSYLVLQPIAILLMLSMALLRHIRKGQERKSLQETDQEQIHHIQMQEEDSYVSHSHNEQVIDFNHQNNNGDKQQYGTFQS